VTIPDLREAVVAYLGAAGIDGASGAYRTAVEAKDLVTAQVTVIPSSVVPTRLTRAKMRNDIAIDVAYRVAVLKDTVPELDPHNNTCEEVQALFSPGVVIATGAPPVITVSRSPLWSQEHLHEHSVFTSIIRVTFMDVISA